MSFDLHSFTVLHSAISLLFLAAGLVLLLGFAAGREWPRLGSAVIALALATSLTGFAFPFTAFLPSHGVGILSLLSLALVIWARYVRHLAGSARAVYRIGLTVAVYFDAFVGIVQASLKIPAVHELAPTLQSPAFAVAQGANVLVFVVLGVLAVRGKSASSASGLQATTVVA